VSTCSISPVGLLRVFVGLPFSGLEVLMLGGAFLHYARRIGAEKELELRTIRQN
jgi:uncharacterized membrane protein